MPPAILALLRHGPESNQAQLADLAALNQFGPGTPKPPAIAALESHSGQPSSKLGRERLQIARTLEPLARLLLGLPPGALPEPMTGRGVVRNGTKGQGGAHRNHGCPARFSVSVVRNPDRDS